MGKQIIQKLEQLLHETVRPCQLSLFIDQLEDQKQVKICVFEEAIVVLVKNRNIPAPSYAKYLHRSANM